METMILRLVVIVIHHVILVMDLQMQIVPNVIHSIVII